MRPLKGHNSLIINWKHIEMVKFWKKLLKKNQRKLCCKKNYKKKIFFCHDSQILSHSFVSKASERPIIWKSTLGIAVPWSFIVTVAKMHFSISFTVTLNGDRTTHKTCYVLHLHLHYNDLYTVLKVVIILPSKWGEGGTSSVQSIKKNKQKNR